MSNNRTNPALMALRNSILNNTDGSGQSVVMMKFDNLVDAILHDDRKLLDSISAVRALDIEEVRDEKD